MFKLLIAGNIGRDAELKEVNGQQVIQFSLAVDQSYKDAQGNKVDKTAWVSCSQWRDKGKPVGILQYLKKGSKVLVEGTPDVHLWTDNAGNKRADLRCRIKEIQLLHTPQAGNPSVQNDARSNVPPGNSSNDSTLPPSGSDITEPLDDLPF